MADRFLTLPNWLKIRTQFSAEPKRHTGRPMPTLCLSCQPSKAASISTSFKPCQRFVASQDAISRPVTADIQTRVRGCVPYSLYLKC